MLAVYFLALVFFVLIEATLAGEIVFDEPRMPSLLYLVEEMMNAIILISVTLYFVKWRYHDEITTLGLHKGRLGRNIGIGVLAGPLIWLTLILLNYLLTPLIGEGPIEQPLLARVQHARNVLAYLVVFASAGLLAPVSEEIFFRGFAYTILKRHYNMSKAIVITNLLFVFVHISPWWFIQIFIVGVMMTVIYEYSQSLITAIVAHSVVNVLSIVRYLVAWS